MNVLLTGAFGNIGGETLKALMKRGMRVRTLDLPNDKNIAAAAKLREHFPLERLDYCWGDIRDSEVLQRALKGIDAVIHLAAIFPPLSEQAPDLATAINVDASRQMIEMLPEGAQFIFASSVAVYGSEQWQRQPLLAADSALQPTDHYGATKLAVEELLAQSSCKWTVLRIAICPPLAVDLANSDMSMLYEIHADARIEFLHPRDAGLAFANAVGEDDVVGRTLLLGGGENCRMTGRDFRNRNLSSLDIDTLPDSVFCGGDVRFFGDWLDTEESQRLLRFQMHTMDSFHAEQASGTALAMRYFMRAVGPLIRRKLINESPYHTAESASRGAQP